MPQKYLITAISLLFVAGTTFLFLQNARELDPEQGKGWWTLAFATPEKPESLSFVVENHSDQTAFQYEISKDTVVVIKNSFTVKHGEKTIITPPLAVDPNMRTNITVTTGTEKKEIYR